MAVCREEVSSLLVQQAGIVISNATAMAILIIKKGA